MIVCCHLALFLALIRDDGDEEVMLQRLAIAISSSYDDGPRDILRLWRSGGDPFPLADGEIFSLISKKLTPLNRKYFTARDKLLIFTVIA